MAERQTTVSLENVKESKSSTEKRKRFGSAVDKSALALALRTSTIEESEPCEVDNVAGDVAVQTEDSRKGRLCLGLILGIILCLLIAGIILACFLPMSDQLDKKSAGSITTDEKSSCCLENKQLDEKIEELKSEAKDMKSQMKELAAMNTTQCPTYIVSTWTMPDKDSDTTDLVIFSINNKPGDEDTIKDMKATYDGKCQGNGRDRYKKKCDGWDSFYLRKQKEFAHTRNWALLKKNWSENAANFKKESVDHYEIGQICGIEYKIPQKIGLALTGKGKSLGWKLEKVKVRADFANGGYQEGWYYYGKWLDTDTADPKDILLTLE